MRSVILWTILLAAVSVRPAGAQQGAAGGASSSITAEQAKQWIDAYKRAHPGNRGKDWDINAKTPAQIKADPAAQQLMSLCGDNQRPVIPLLAWEYGGNDHQWINPQASALVYCVYTPVKTPTANWRYVRGEITADVFVRFPEQNPCRSQAGAKQVSACIGDDTNFEILVDTASINDGRDVGLSLSTAPTNLKLILPDGTKVDLWRDE
jgi:hypothetical protein